MIRGSVEEEQEDNDQDYARKFLRRNRLLWHYVGIKENRSFIIGTKLGMSCGDSELESRG